MWLLHLSVLVSTLAASPLLPVSRVTFVVSGLFGVRTVSGLRKLKQLEDDEANDSYNSYIGTQQQLK